MDRIALLRDLLRAAGLDRDRATCGAIIASRAGTVGLTLVSAMRDAYVNDLQSWNASRVATFLARHDYELTTLMRSA